MRRAEMTSRNGPDAYGQTSADHMDVLRHGINQSVAQKAGDQQNLGDNRCSAGMGEVNEKTHSQMEPPFDYTVHR